MELAVIAKIVKKAKVGGSTQEVGGLYRVVDLDTQKCIDVTDKVLVKAILEGGRIHGIAGVDLTNYGRYILRFNYDARGNNWPTLTINCDNGSIRHERSGFTAIKVVNNVVVLSDYTGVVSTIPLSALTSYYLGFGISNIQVKKTKEVLKITAVDGVKLEKECVSQEEIDRAENRITVMQTGYKLVNGYAVSQGLNIPVLVLPHGAVGVAREGFRGCNSLKTFISCDTATGIMSDAFRGCSNLSKVKLNEGLRTIGKDSFFNTALESVDMPSTITEIGSGAFCGCSNLKNVKLNEGLAHIGSYAFSRTAIEEIVLPYSLIDVGRDTFYECKNLKRILCKGRVPNNIQVAARKRIKIEIIR